MNNEEITGYKSPTLSELQAIQVVELKLKELKTLTNYYCQCEILKTHIDVKLIELGALIKEAIKK
jgi:hypothetical protein